MLTIMAMLTKNVATNGPTEYTKRYINFQAGVVPGEPNESNSHESTSTNCSENNQND